MSEGGYARGGSAMNVDSGHSSLQTNGIGESNVESDRDEAESKVRNKS